ncbi:MAG: hypothetical protein WBZ23_06445, partial [Pseudolabrys sp.]
VVCSTVRPVRGSKNAQVNNEALARTSTTDYSATCHFDSALDTANMTVAPSMNKMPSGTRSARRGAQCARLSEVKDKPRQVPTLA